MLRVEVGALGAHQVKNMRGGVLDRRESARRLCGWVWVFRPRLGLSLIFFFDWIQFMCFRGGDLSGVTGFSCRLLPTQRGRFLALEQEDLCVMRLMFPACRVYSIAVLI